MNNQERKTLLTTAFAGRFDGQAPTLWAQAPGRVDLMGSHTDYNEGYVLTMSINRNTWIAFRPRDDRQVRVASLNADGVSTFSLDDIQHDAATPWTDYVRGVAAVLAQEGYPLHGFDGLVHSTVPFGSGLSSSAALEVATATVFEMLGDFELGGVQKAILTQKAENEFVGVNCGILDQFTSANGQAGHAVLLDCRHLTGDTAAIAAGVSVVICDTRAERALTGSEYAERRAQCEEGAAILHDFYPDVSTLRDVPLDMLQTHEHDMSEVVFKRCQFIIEENARVLALAEALPANDRAAIKELSADSYAGAMELYELGVPEMVAMFEAMMSGPGVIGARQAGAGFGGCMVAFVEDAAVEAFAAHVAETYQAKTGIAARVYPVAAAPGPGPV